MHLAIVASIEDAFKGASSKDFIDKLVGMNVDVASMNLGMHKAVDMSLKEKEHYLNPVEH